MKQLIKKQRFAVIIAVYWILLLYIVAALVWWFIALENQNNLMLTYRSQQLKKSDPAYFQQYANMRVLYKRKTTQYIGEGIIFLLLIIVGAVFVYRATRQQIKLSHQQQNFMMAVTHELKTPVAIISLNLETLQKRKLEEGKQQKLIAHTLTETSRLDTLINNILIASQLEAGRYDMHKQVIDFSNLVENGKKNFSTRFQQRSIQADIQEHIYVEGELILLQMLFNNLVDNALKYSPVETEVNISLRKIGRVAELKISDRGEGIKYEEREKIFEKFYRVGGEETRSTKGTGLGLYLCKKIIHDHNGSIGITDNNPAGSIFIVRLQTTEI